MTAIKSNAINPDLDRIEDSLIDTNTGEPAFFYVGNSVRFDVSPMMNGQPLMLDANSTLSLEIIPPNNTSSKPLATVSSTMTTAPIALMLSTEMTGNIPAGNMIMVIKYTDPKKDVVTLYAGYIQVRDDFITGRSAEVTIAPEVFLRSGQLGAENGIATLDENSRIPLSQIPNSIINDNTYTLYDNVDSSFTEAGQFAHFNGDGTPVTGEIQNDLSPVGFTLSGRFGDSNSVRISSIGIRDHLVFTTEGNINPTSVLNWFIPTQDIMVNSTAVSEGTLIATSETSITDAVKIATIRLMKANSGIQNRTERMTIAYNFIT